MKMINPFLKVDKAYID